MLDDPIMRPKIGAAVVALRRAFPELDCISVKKADGINDEYSYILKHVARTGFPDGASLTQADMAFICEDALRVIIDTNPEVIGDVSFEEWPAWLKQWYKGKALSNALRGAVEGLDRWKAFLNASESAPRRPHMKLRTEVERVPPPPSTPPADTTTDTATTTVFGKWKDDEVTATEHAAQEVAADDKEFREVAGAVSEGLPDVVAVTHLDAAPIDALLHHAEEYTMYYDQVPTKVSADVPVADSHTHVIVQVRTEHVSEGEIEESVAAEKAPTEQAVGGLEAEGVAASVEVPTTVKEMEEKAHEEATGDRVDELAEEGPPAKRLRVSTGAEDEGAEFEMVVRRELLSRVRGAEKGSEGKKRFNRTYAELVQAGPSGALAVAAMDYRDMGLEAGQVADELVELAMSMGV